MSINRWPQTAQPMNPDEIVQIRTRDGTYQPIYKSVNEGGATIQFAPVTYADLAMTGWRRDTDADALTRLTIAMERLLRYVDSTAPRDRNLNDPAGPTLAQAVTSIVAGTAPDSEVMLRQRRNYPTDTATATVDDSLVQRTG